MIRIIAICTIITILAVSTFGRAQQSGTKSKLWPQTSFTPKPDFGLAQQSETKSELWPQSSSTPSWSPPDQIRNLETGSRKSPTDIYRALAPPRKHQSPEGIQRRQINPKNGFKLSDLDIIVVPDAYRTSAQSLLNELAQSVNNLNANQTAENDKNNSLEDRIPITVQKASLLLIKSSGGVKLFIVPEETLTNDELEPQPTTVQQSRVAYDGSVPNPPESTQSKVWPITGQTKTATERTPIIVQQTQTAIDNHHNDPYGGFIPQSHVPVEQTWPKGYKFGYDYVLNDGSRVFRKERADRNNVVSGSYGFQLSNGLIRLVRYTADQNGFRPIIYSNEPGLIPISLPSDGQQTKQ